MNLVLGLLVLAASSTSVWAGITNPEGGLWAGLRNVITGQPNTAHVSATSVAFATALAATGTTGGTATTSYAGVGGDRGAILATARDWLGVPYRWGGNTRAGVDCSGLVKAVYGAHGITLPRVSAAQALVGKRVSVSTAQPADLVYFGTPAHHVAIMLGGGQCLHAPNAGGVVRIESLASIAKSLPGSPVSVRNVVGNAAPSEDVAT